jgi:hypothetical protein
MKVILAVHFGVSTKHHRDISVQPRLAAFKIDNLHDLLSETLSGGTYAEHFLVNFWIVFVCVGGAEDAVPVR